MVVTTKNMVNSSVTIQGTTLRGNNASLWGGGLYITGNVFVAVRKCTFYNNEAKTGIGHQTLKSTGTHSCCL